MDDAPGLVSYFNASIFLIIFAVSFFDIIKSKKTDRVKIKRGDIWLDMFYCLVSLAFIQFYYRYLNGMAQSRDEIRLYIFCAGFAMFIGVASRAIRHGDMDWTICKCCEGFKICIQKILAKYRGKSSER